MIPFTLRSALAAYFYSQGLTVGISCKCGLTGITVLLKMLVFHKKKKKITAGYMPKKLRKTEILRYSQSPHFRITSEIACCNTS